MVSTAEFSRPLRRSQREAASAGADASRVATSVAATAIAFPSFRINRLSVSIRATISRRMFALKAVAQQGALSARLICVMAFIVSRFAALCNESVLFTLMKQIFGVLATSCWLDTNWCFLRTLSQPLLPEMPTKQGPQSVVRFAALDLMSPMLIAFPAEVYSASASGNAEWF